MLCNVVKGLCPMDEHFGNDWSSDTPVVGAAEICEKCIEYVRENGQTGMELEFLVK